MADNLSEIHVIGSVEGGMDVGQEEGAVSLDQIPVDEERMDVVIAVESPTADGEQEQLIGHVDVSLDVSELTPTSRQQSQQVQKYSSKWERLDDFKDWLTAVPGKELLAWCRICEQSMRARKTDLFKHGQSFKHRSNMQSVEMGQPIHKPQGVKYSTKFQKSLLAQPELADWLCAVPNDPYRGWCKYCACGLTPQLKFLKNHANSRKHQRNQTNAPQEPPLSVSRPRRSPGAGGPPVYNLDASDVADLVAPGRPLVRTRTNIFSDLRHKSRDPKSMNIGNRKVGFIGSGQIAQAIAQGLMEQGLLSNRDIIVSAPTERNMVQWRRWNCRITKKNDDVIRHADIIFLAVKSSVLAAVASHLAPVSDTKTRLVVSLVPGVLRERLIELLEPRLKSVEGGKGDVQENLHVVRASLNKMVSIGEGFCAYCMDPDLPHALYLVVETMFSAIGTCVHVEESLMDAYSTMVSSGAAFTCAFIEALVQGGVNQNIPWDEALMAAATVVSGTSELLIRCGLEPSALRKAIATPGGSTIAALNTLQRGGLDDAVVSAMEVGCTKTEEAGSKV